MLGVRLHLHLLSENGHTAPPPFFGPPTVVGTGPIRSPSLLLLVIIVLSYPFFSKTALTISMKLGRMLDIDKLRKVTKPVCPKKFRFINYS